jgi:hypothetical protein
MSRAACSSSRSEAGLYTKGVLMIMLKATDETVLFESVLFVPLKNESSALG